MESFKKTVSFAYIFSIVGQLCELSFYFLIFKYFPIEQVGLYSWALAVITFFAFSLDLGLNQTLIRGFSKELFDLKQTLIASAIIRLPIILIALAVIQFLKIHEDQYLILLLLGLYQILIVGDRIFQTWLRSNNRQTLANLFTSISAAVRLGIVSIMIFFWNLYSIVYLAMGLLLSYGFLVIVFASVTYKLYKKSITQTHPSILGIYKTLRNIGIPGIIFTLIALFTVIQNRLDWLMVSSFVSQIELANYSLANKLYEMFIMFLGISITTAYPWMCNPEISKRFKNNMNLYFGLFVFSGITISLLLAMYTPAIFKLLFGDKYENANFMIRILMFSASMSVICMFLYYQLISKNLERTILLISGVATVFQILSNLLLIPKFGGLGASIGMSVLITTTFIGLLWIAYKQNITKNTILLSYLIFWLITFLLAIVISVIQMPLWTGLVLFIVFSTIGMYFVIVTNVEKQFLCNWLSQYLNKVKNYII